jgi:two-component system CheB/CheR fusion protein
MHLPVGVIHVNEQYDIQFINNAARRLLHIHGNALGEDLVHLAQDLPSREFRRAIDLAFSDGRTTTLEDIPATEPATGEHQYLRISVLPQPDNHYETVVQVLVQDVTDAVTRQHALQEMLDRERAETASLRDQVQRLSETNGSLLAANQELTVINLELRATNEEYLVGNEELQAAAEEVETLNEELQATNEELETLNEELQATVEELRATNEDLQSRSVELEELAVSLQAQRTEIDIERARLEVILSSMADAVIVVDRSGRTLLTNTAYQSMFPGSFQPLDANGQPLRQEALPWMAAARGEDCEMEFMVQEWDGRRRWFEARGRPIDGSLGAQGGMAVIRDITDRSIHRLQEEFLSTASHELRGPLTALNGFLSMAQRALGSQVDMDKLRSYLERARHQTDRLQILVRDLVDVTRLQKGTIRLEMGPVDALEVARQAIDTAQQLASEPPITPNLPGEPVMVQGDATRLEQVLLNLLTNAQTYAPESEAIELAIASSDGEAAITVCDQGSGIPEGDLPHLFTRFYTGTNESAAGLGLGLYISQELVDAMNGTISVESGEGKGTTFTVRLPLADV